MRLGFTRITRRRNSRPAARVSTSAINRTTYRACYRAGQIGNGCVFNGQVGIIDADFNAYDLQFSIANCTDAAVNSDYAGLGATHDATGELFYLFEELLDVDPKDGVPDCELTAFLNTVPDKGHYSCYAVNEVEVKDKEGTDKDELKIKKAEVSLPDGWLFDPDMDMVQVGIGGLTFDIPRGSFQRKGGKENYEFKSPKDARPSLEVHLHLYRDQWDLKWKYADVSMLDCDDGCQVSLIINGFGSFQQIQLDDKDKFKRDGMPPVTDDAFTIGADDGENAVILHLVR